MAKVLKQQETRVTRTYRGGMLLDAFLGKAVCEDTFLPEDWISSFVEAKNMDYIPNEGITHTADGRMLTEAVCTEDLGQGRETTGMLIKLLDSAERLGIQVHPDDAFSQRVFGTPYGKTECWHILQTRMINGETPKVYVGFKPHVTRELWEQYYRTQNVDGMLSSMNSIEVHPGDTILVRGGMPHAIGGGCLLLEVQQPSDYTMRCETVPLSGPPYTPQQIHYGAGEQAMLDCFDYTIRTYEESMDRCVMKARITQFDTYVRHDYVTYDDTPYFALAEFSGEAFVLHEESYLTLISLETGGVLETKEDTHRLTRGDKFFVPAYTRISCKNAHILVCYPPKK